MRTLHAAHRRITDARARMPAQWRIPDRLSWGAEGQLMTQMRYSRRNRPLKAALFVPVVICHDDLNGRR